MPKSQTKPLTLDDIDEIKARASELRAQALSDMFKSFISALRSLPLKLAAAVRKPGHA